MSDIGSIKITHDVDLPALAKKENFSDYEVKEEKQLQLGKLYSSNVVTFTLSDTKGSKPSRETKVVLKYSHVKQTKRQALGNFDGFKNELTFYEWVVPTYSNFYEKASSKKIGKVRVPGYITGSLDNIREYIHLRDIIQDGFQKPERLKPLDEDHLRLLIKNLANFHGTGFALKHRDRKMYDELVQRSATDILYFKGKNPLFMPFMTVSLDIAKSFLKGPKEIELINKITKDLPEMLHHLTLGSTAEPYDTIVHGDYGGTNVWFKYNERNIPEDVCTMDWQTWKAASVFLDLTYIFMNYSTEVRKQYYRDAIEWYYSGLDEVLKSYGLDVNLVYPRDAFNADEKKFSYFSIAVGTAFSYLFCMEPSLLPKLTDLISGDAEKVSKILELITPIGKKRIQDLFTDCVSYGYI